ncbi:MAG: hypothetical protein DLM72_20070 [Candidatus Nitrosopolaris wilkensis]|nr:MAG: hypothetical protein DLM72_20070 [Candidatus Nitrosopolaris wilkensis]
MRYSRACSDSHGLALFPAKDMKYLDFLEVVRSEIIHMLQRREINENQYKMLDDRVIEYLNKITDLK